MKITNISKGPKSIWSASVKGMVFIPAGVTVDVEIDDAERKAANPEWFSFDVAPVVVDQPLKPNDVVDHETASDDQQIAPRPRGRPRKDV